MSVPAKRRSSLSKPKLAPVGDIPPTTMKSDKKRKSSLIFNLGIKVISLGYGVVTLFGFLVTCYTGDRRFRVMSTKDKQDLEDARERLWNLQKKPYGLSHEFCELKDGTKLHYMLSRPNIEVRGKTGLVVFLHGFPDSWHIWNSFLRNSDIKDSAVLVAVDLPGYGGSDSLDVYDANNVLETLTEFTIKMRDRFLLAEEQGNTRGPVVFVAHDWGATVGFRLASEAPSLADRWILSNSFHPAVATANFQNRFASMKRMLMTWRRSPSNTRPLFSAYATIKPILKQLVKSSYIFVFQLPRPFLADLLGRVGDFFAFRVLNSTSIMPPPNKIVPLSSSEGWDMLASSVGPGLNQCGGPEELKYPFAVEMRAKENRGGYFEKIRYYRENLLLSRWSKSLHTVWELSKLNEQASSLLSSHSPVSSTAGSTTESPTRRRSSIGGVFDTGPPGTLGAATTILWGSMDVAVDYAIALDGIRDYLGVKPSHVVMLPKCGHWTPLEVEGRKVFEKVVLWAVQGESQELGEVVADGGKIVLEL